MLSSGKFLRAENPAYSNYFLYLTNDFEKDIERLDIQKRTLGIFLKGLRNQPVAESDRLAKSKVFRSTLHRTWRFIFQEEKGLLKDEITLVFLRRILKGKAGRDENTYTYIYDNPVDFANSLNDEDKTKVADEFTEWRKSMSKAEKEAEKKLQEEKQVRLQEISQWLNEFHPKIKFDVYETKEWKEFAAKKVERYSSEFISLIHDIANNKPFDSEQIPHKDRKLYKATYQQVCVIYENMPLDNGNRVVFIHNGAVGERNNVGELVYPELDEKIQVALTGSSETDKRFSFNLENGRYKLHQVSRAADRAYPKDVLNIEAREIWLDIQENKDDNANLSLMPDQVTLLENIKFPIFINGQAGSGKSTILFYLFAEILLRRIVDEKPAGKILFLTENKELLKNSLREIARILYLNPRYSEWITQIGKLKDVEEIEQYIAQFFSTFKEFLLGKIRNGVQDFPEDKYINFFRFREEYNHSIIDPRIKNRYSAEVCWYVIRSFVKGYFSGDDFLEPNRFGEIYSNDREKIDPGTYTEIFNEVYLKFYKRQLEDTGYWDYVDLVKAVMHSGESLAEYSILVCDETQDFTKVELELLIKFSEFADGYDLKYQKKFPIIFAGDPFQTVNPTGFSWRRLRSMFTEEIVEKFHLDLNVAECFEELTMNYRSTPAIVKLANVIQFFRHVFLDETDLKFPQEARLEEYGKIPELLLVKDNLNEFKQLNVEIIVPDCELDEEEQFKKKDGLHESYVIIL